MPVEITYRYTPRPKSAWTKPGEPHEAIQRLNKGNEAFAELVARAGQSDSTASSAIEIDARALGLDVDGRRSAPQAPFAAVLGCADARVPIELVFKQGPNELFVVRVAGNSLGTDVLGSFHYAVGHLQDSLRVLVVLGHSGCGALTATVDTFLDPGGYLSIATNEPLRSIIDRHLISVQASARALARAHGSNVVERPSYREALIEASIATNAALAAYTLQAEFHNKAPRQLKAVYGVFLLDSHTVWTPSQEAAGSSGLCEPPQKLSEFRAFGDLLARSDRIAGLLK